MKPTELANGYKMNELCGKKEIAQFMDTLLFGNNCVEPVHMHEQKHFWPYERRYTIRAARLASGMEKVHKRISSKCECAAVLLAVSGYFLLWYPGQRYPIRAGCRAFTDIEAAIAYWKKRRAERKVFTDDCYRTYRANIFIAALRKLKKEIEAHGEDAVLEKYHGKD